MEGGTSLLSFVLIAKVSLHVELIHFEDHLFFSISRSIGNGPGMFSFFFWQRFVLMRIIAKSYDHEGIARVDDDIRKVRWISSPGWGGRRAPQGDRASNLLSETILGRSGRGELGLLLHTVRYCCANIPARKPRDIPVIRQYRGGDKLALIQGR